MNDDIAMAACGVVPPVASTDDLNTASPLLILFSNSKRLHGRGLNH